MAAQKYDNFGGTLKLVGCWFQCYLVLTSSSYNLLLTDDTDLATPRTMCAQALKNGLKVVLCVGETKDQYEAGVNQQVTAMSMKLVTGDA